MGLLRLSCPRCRKPLVQVPRTGLTLYLWCAVHGPVVLRPLEQLDQLEPDHPVGSPTPFEGGESRHADWDVQAL